MKRMWMMLLAMALLVALPAAVRAQADVADEDADAAAVTEEEVPMPGRVFALVGACLGAGLIVIGGGISISRISAQALESIARQPEAAGQMFLSWLIPAAMIEGAMLFGVVICLMALLTLT